MVDRDVNPTQGFKATREQLGDWGSEEKYLARKLGDPAVCDRGSWVRVLRSGLPLRFRVSDALARARVE